MNLRLHHKQGVAFQTPATEVLYGGAAGGGKSHLMRVAAIWWCANIDGLQVYLFRRIREDLIKNHMEGPNGFRAMLAGWSVAGFVTIVEDEIRFWNGSKIYLCHCKDEKDIYKYQGAEIHVLLIDELTHFLEGMYRFLRNRVRMVGVNLPTEHEGRFPRIMCGANPGNVGHQWVKQSFVDPGPMELRRMSPAEGGMLRQFIPAALDDNPSMTEDDPTYESRLEGLGSKALVQAMRWGDWNVVEGAFFDNWRSDRHQIRPVKIPEHWLRFTSFDFGSAKPFSVGWWAVAPEDTRLLSNGGARLILPRGGLVRYREWYGMQPGQPDVGIKLTAEQIAKGIKDREQEGEKIAYRVADPAIFAEAGGPSIAQRMSALGVIQKAADNKRVTARGAMGGWDQMRARLDGEGPMRPMVMCFETCRDSIRTIPALQHDSNRPEDLDTSAEDHAADEWRYGLMSRPWVRPAPKIEKTRDSWNGKADDYETSESDWKTA